MDLKKLSLREARELVRQLEEEGIDCPDCNKKLLVTDSRCPNCDRVPSKFPLFAIIAILAGIAVAAFLILYIIGLF